MSRAGNRGTWKAFKRLFESDTSYARMRPIVKARCLSAGSKRIVVTEARKVAADQDPR
jgi:hypothetical protein